MALQEADALVLPMVSSANVYCGLSSELGPRNPRGLVLVCMGHSWSWTLTSIQHRCCFGSPQWNLSCLFLWRLWDNKSPDSSRLLYPSPTIVAKAPLTFFSWWCFPQSNVLTLMGCRFHPCSLFQRHITEGMWESFVFVCMKTALECTSCLSS